MASTVDDAWFIYALMDPRDGCIRYIGKSVNVEQRVKAHLRETGSTKKIRWIQSLKRASLTPEIILLAEGFGDWESAEIEWIAYFRNLGHDLTNATRGGEGLHDPSPETRAKIGAAQRALRSNPDHVAKLREQLYDSPVWRAAVSKG
ncbi:GIY-YIG nuclease family protein [Nocardia sp. NPDC055053]